MLFVLLILFCVNGFGQNKEEIMNDSVLVATTGKTYQEYLLHFQKAEKDNEKLKNKIFKEWRERKDKTQVLHPAVLNVRYSTAEFPLVIIIAKGKFSSLNDFSDVSFSKIKKISHLGKEGGAALYGTQGQYGVYIIEVE